MPMDVWEAQLFRAKKNKPNQYEDNPVAEADVAHVYPEAPRVNQPFRLLEGVTQADFKEGDKLFLKGRVEGYGVRLWKLTVRDVRSGGKDVVLECDAEG
ncbi:hypothetical protein [Agrobacterium fabrum]|uniref:hypothetical protein n=1 Tax=Agrobacterium fabrum TaxID=1176649 RepID=UPI003BA09626